MWAFGSRRKIVHHDREAWQQAGGTAAEQEAEKAHLQPQAPNREKELKVLRVQKLSKLAPSIIFPPKATPSKPPPNT